MKRIYITFATAIIACSALTISCSKKKENIAPNKTTTTTTTTTTSKGSATPDSYPFDVSKMFLPTGFWSGGEGSGGTTGAVVLNFATDTLWTNSNAQFQATNKIGWGGGAFLNNNVWAPKFHFAAGATKLTFDLKADVGVTLRVIAFPGVPAINKRDSIVSTDANAWITKTITFTGTYPDSLTGSDFANFSFAPPNGAANGATYNFAIRNMILDK